MDTLIAQPTKTDGMRQAAMFGVPIEPAEQRPSQPTVGGLEVQLCGHI